MERHHSRLKIFKTPTLPAGAEMMRITTTKEIIVNGEKLVMVKLLMDYYGTQMRRQPIANI